MAGEPVRQLPQGIRQEAVLLGQCHPAFLLPGPQPLHPPEGIPGPGHLRRRLPPGAGKGNVLFQYGSIHPLLLQAAGAPGADVAGASPQGQKQRPHIRAGANPVQQLPLKPGKKPGHPLQLHLGRPNPAPAGALFREDAAPQAPQ